LIEGSDGGGGSPEKWAQEYPGDLYRDLPIIGFAGGAAQDL
jgi:hypothetical protein